MRRFSLFAVVGALVLLGACSKSTSTMTATRSSPIPHTSVPSLEPAAMPTAAPLFTPTPASPESTQVAGVPTMTSDADSLVAATVNGIVITRESYEAKLAQARIHFLKAPGIDVATKEGEKALRHLEGQVLDWMIDQVLIETESIRQQVRIDLITAAVRDSVTASLPREEMQVHVRHILLSDESIAKSVLQKLKDGQDFAAIAREFSEDETTRATGGDIGFVPRGLMPPDFEKASFALGPGEISDVIRTQFGYHIVQVIEIDPKRPVPDEFWPIVQERAFESWLAARRAKAEIRRVR